MGVSSHITHGEKQDKTPVQEVRLQGLEVARVHEIAQNDREEVARIEIETEAIIIYATNK